SDVKQIYLLSLLLKHVFNVRIIHGEKAPENSMPYMVSVQDNKGRHVCGGFLITEDFVLTSAHCDKLGLTHVALGNHNLKKFYVTYLWYNYIFNKQSSIRPQSTDKNQVCQVAGWGKTKRDGEPVDELRVVGVSVIDKQVCKKQWPGLPANVICAGGYKTTKGFCQGDSGGPLVCDDLAVGLVSFNYYHNCNYPDKPNVYTDISKYQIKANIKKSVLFNAKNLVVWKFV
uniref:Peptidase S1 domain-containing protein n=1 Tax=Maylandia zebra TaxID=106582 RepID=A0A3P9DFA7_9CICH